MSSMDPVVMSGLLDVHLFRECGYRALAKPCTCCHLYRSSPGGMEWGPLFCVSNVAGVKMNGSLAYVESGTRALFFTISITSVIKVMRPWLEKYWISHFTDGVSYPLPWSLHLARMKQVECPGTTLSWKVPLDHIYINNGGLRSMHATMKCVPWSEFMCLTGLQIERNLLKAFLKF